PATFKGSMGSSVLKIFDMTMATTGINEKTALQLGLNVDKVYLAPANHAGYYPGGQAMTMKVLFEKETYKLLGAQIVGYDGVDKRIDVLATAIFAGMSALELKDLDLSYAPPYSSAKDPVNLAGFMIENIAAGNLHQFFLPEMDHLSKDATWIDARTPGEYSRGHIDGFINIPVDKIREHLAELDKSKPVYVHCQTGLRSYIACRILMQHGYTAYNFSGGYRLWESVHLDKLAAEKIHPCGMDK
ncbi:MAG: rhodanese-like domain-containing protein, partial [Eubacteriales bacterium]